MKNDFVLLFVAIPIYCPAHQVNNLVRPQREEMLITANEQQFVLIEQMRDDKLLQIQSSPPALM